MDKLCCMKENTCSLLIEIFVQNLKTELIQFREALVKVIFKPVRDVIVLRHSLSSQTKWVINLHSMYYKDHVTVRRLEETAGKSVIYAKRIHFN